MLTIPPLNVGFRIGNQSVRASKFIDVFDSAEMPVIVLFSLVVESQNADALNNVREPIFEEVG